MTMAGQERYPDWSDVETLVFDWGYMKWLTTRKTHGIAIPAIGMVTMLPGQGHARHNHPASAELLYVVSGTGEQMVELDDGTPDVRQVSTGDVIHVPQAVFHSTLNTGWAPMQVLAMYSPAGAEEDLLTQPDLMTLTAGELPTFRPERS
ncbi:cupin domain-containing protein [Pseudonocardia sp.]|uniref:cupin domain-containing protein n=1 Tax=Pseudonocardia sp. TaxID=60912 RepID=UPI00261FE44F|nr:cupin domain-containing protein [Pseudonocardia sp.]